MRKFLISAVAVLVLGVGIVLIMWQRHRLKQVEADNVALKQVAAELRQENQSLSDIRKTSDSLSQDDLRDLMRLRAQATRMYEVEQENSQLKAERDHLAKQLSQNASGSTPSEQSLEQLRLRSKDNFAKQWGLALFMFADDHNGKFPANLADAASYLPSNVAELGSSYGMGVKGEMIELLYHGPMKDVSGEIILMREKEPIKLSDGRWAKVYLFCDGHVETQISVDGDFSNWEKEHMPKETPIPASP